MILRIYKYIPHIENDIIWRNIALLKSAYNRNYLRKNKIKLSSLYNIAEILHKRNRSRSYAFNNSFIEHTAAFELRNKNALNGILSDHRNIFFGNSFVFFNTNAHYGLIPMLFYLEFQLPYLQLHWVNTD